jgi:flagellar hook-associated protein 3 FlgL
MVEAGAVRVPNINIQRATLEGIQSNLREVERATGEIVSGRRVSAPSDDPAAARSIMRTNANLQANEQVLRNMSRVTSFMAMEDVVLAQLGDVLTRGRELALAQGGSTADASTRETAARELQELMAFVRDLANTRVGDRHLFGGTQSTTPPLAPGATSADPLPTGGSPVEIGPGRTLTPNRSAQEVFGDSGALAALEELAAALQANDPEGIHGSQLALKGAFDQVQILVGDLGSRMNRLDLAASRSSDLELNLVEYRSDLEDVDFEEAISRLSSRQAAYQAALLATSRILSVNLTDYLR